MQSDYDQIRKDNIEEYGKGERHLAFLGNDLYADPTHFVFEILQNAEDAEASKVRFIVSHDKLEVMHDGRPFTDKDVRGVCGIGEGEKADNLTKIGRFGIGFKSVYAYTTRPEIHSGDKHFCIKKYVRPHAVEPRPIDSRTTLFVFPFNKEEPDRNVAYAEISKRVGQLNIRTLLFLKSIKEVEYKTPDATGRYLREDLARGSAREVKIVGQSNGDEETEKWLVFSRPVTPEISQNIYVELGFLLATDKDGKQTIERVQEQNTPLVVYFPTKKRTDLGFLIQGPYRTTLARDNIPTDDPWNEVLINETAKLTVASLHKLKELGLLTVSLLNTLPIDGQRTTFRPIYTSIYTRVKEALMKEELLPAHDGSFVAANDALLARGTELMKLLISATKLSRLWESNSNIKWLPSTITEDLRRYLIYDLKVEEVTPESFATKITRNFMADQSDNWVQDFYCFLHNHKSLWQTRRQSSRYSSDGVLLNKPILRRQDGSHVKPFSNRREPNAYLSATSTAKSLPKDIVKSFVKVPRRRSRREQRDEALKFLKELGIPEFDFVEEVLKRVLPKYTKQAKAKACQRRKGAISPKTNRLDLKKIEQALKQCTEEKRQRLMEQLAATPFILCTVPSTGKCVYRKADRIYFRSDQLCDYFEGNESFAYVDSDHAQRTLFEQLGVVDSVRITKRPQDSKGYVPIYSRPYSGHCRGRAGFDPDISVDGLLHALNNPTVKKSSFIWNEIAIRYVDYIRGIVESSTRQNYIDSRRDERTSKFFGDLLIDREWLPDSKGKMHKPCDLRLDDLHGTFERHRRVAEQLAMKTDEIAELCEKTGVSQQTLDVAQQYQGASPEDQQKINRILYKETDRDRPEFPHESSTDPVRRKQRIQRHYSDAPQKSYDKQVRTVRTTVDDIDQHTQLRQWYTNESGQMVCQICEDEMPFKKRNGEYYFEAVEALTGKYLSREHESQFLALCPLCSAKYKEFVKSNDETMTEVRQALIKMESDKLEVPLTFRESSASVRFVQTHVIDLQAILSAGQP